MQLHIRTMCLGAFLMAVVLIMSCTTPRVPEQAETLDRVAAVNPDYTDIILPPNIAPLNFQIEETGSDYRVRASSTSGTEILVRSTKGIIQFPIKSWQRLLEANLGESLTIDIFVKQDGVWKEFRSIKNHIARETIDPVLVYRLINPAFKYWNQMGIYQRNLESFEEDAVLVNRMTDENCMNCHNFCMNDPSNMVFHMRAGTASGTYISVDGEFHKVSLKTEFNKGGAYPSWHPNGNLIAFSVNDLTMFYHSTGESRDVLDRKSDLVVYHIDKNMISASPQIAALDRMGTFPSWSPDGQHLYFCSAPPLETFINTEIGDLEYDKIRYDLMRVSYDAQADTWGELETVLSANELGKSVVMPRVSPDGHFVLFCLANYGSFPIYHDHSDLYILDVEKGDMHRLNINSNETDSFHS